MPSSVVELDEDEVAAAEMRRRVADDEGLEVGDLHGGNSVGERHQAGVVAADEVGRRFELRLLRLARDLGEQRTSCAGGFEARLQPRRDAELDQRRVADQDDRRVRLAERCGVVRKRARTSDTEMHFRHPARRESGRHPCPAIPAEARVLHRIAAAR